MRKAHLGTFFDAALVQAGWWACVLGAANGYPLLGPAVVAALLAFQLGTLPPDLRGRAWRFVLLLGIVGTLVDSLLAGLGVMTLRGAFAPWLAPLWITALWCQFATVVPAFSALSSRLPVAALLGAVGGPLAYGGGARLGAASLHPMPWVSLLAIGVVWTMVFPWMLRRYESSVRPEGHQTLEPVPRLATADPAGSDT